METRIAIQLSKSKASYARKSCNLTCRKFFRTGTQDPTFPIGGDERNRTADPLLAKQVLSRLSYIPHTHHGCQIDDSRFELENRNPLSEMEWWAFLGSNQGPHAYQACALTS